MNADDTRELVLAISYRNDERWVTPSGAFLDLLRRFAAEGRVAAIPTACRLYFRLGHAAAQTYVPSRLPAIIVNYYRPFIDGVDFSKFIAWTTRNPEWADRIRMHACSANLVHTVDQMVASLQRS